MEILIGKEFPQRVGALVEQAKQSIKIVVFDWRWYENDPGSAVQLFNQTLVRASRRGVQIQAVVNSPAIIRILVEQGIRARRVVLKNLIHAKLMIIDDAIVILGSHNYTQSAFTANQEISVVLSVDNPVNRFNDFFQSLYLA